MSESPYSEFIYINYINNFAKIAKFTEISPIYRLLNYKSLLINHYQNLCQSNNQKKKATIRKHLKVNCSSFRPIVPLTTSLAVAKIHCHTSPYNHLS